VLIDDLSDYLSSGGITGTIYKGFLPPTPDTAIAIYETGGVAPIRAMGNVAGRAVVERPRIQVVCRAGQYDYQAARLKAQDVFALLDGMPARTVNGVSYLDSAAVQSPFLMGRDESGRPKIACNYDVVKRLSTG
jgi:hypothetical protein